MYLRGGFRLGSVDGDGDGEYVCMYFVLAAVSARSGRLGWMGGTIAICR